MRCSLVLLAGMMAPMTADRKARDIAWQLACLCYGLATAVWVVGIERAAAKYPGSYDWSYTVISALASRKHNPEGAPWFAGAIVGAMLLLWPVTSQLTRAERSTKPSRWTVIALWTGVIGAAIVGTERLIFFHFSNVLRKGHEGIALVAFLGFYAGIISLYVHRVRTRPRASMVPTIAIVTPLVAVGLRELVLYISQRGIGWADHDWRGAGTPLWLSFALWQWVAVVVLWAAIGHLLFTTHRNDTTPAMKPEGSSPLGKIAHRTEAEEI